MCSVNTYKLHRGRGEGLTMLVFSGKDGFLPLLLLTLQVGVLVFSFSVPSEAFELPNATIDDVGGAADVELLSLRRSVAEIASSPLDAPPIDNGSYILAAKRTERKDPLDGLKHYTGGWNISEKHYWASVGYTAAPLFAIGVIWFVCFGLVLLILLCRRCCCPGNDYSYSRVAYVLSLICLICFTVAAIIGSIFLYAGQGKFHSITTTTLEFVVQKADITVGNLTKFSDSLSAAKDVRVKQFFLSQTDQNNIDTIEKKVNTSAEVLSTRTSQNSKDIRNLLDIVRLVLIVVAAVMLLLAFLGFLLSIFGLSTVVYILGFIGWILVAATFILSGVFLLLHNVVSDTCVSMDEWVQHPHAHTSLDDILPCVDVTTAQETLNQSKRITMDIVNGINKIINGVANGNFTPGTPLVYYNQSGPLVPTLCSPWAVDLTDNRNRCASGQVNFDNATAVWKNHTCTAYYGSPDSETCNSVGRFTPDIFNQLKAAIIVSNGIYSYSPFLVQLQDCTFVRETFTSIHTYNCPDLSKFSKWVYLGLAVVAGAVVLSLVFWVIYARERRHRVYNKQVV